MPETDLFLLFVRRFNALGLTYMVTGSVAGVLYGEPRVTHDVDLVLELEGLANIRRFAAGFPLEDFYCPPEEVLIEESRRRQRGHFNLIHHQSGFRADVYLAGKEQLHRWAMARRREVPLGDVTVQLAPPEYVIVRKLEFYREGGSEKHLRDIAAIRDVSSGDIDEDVLAELVRRQGVTAEWKAVSGESK